MLNTKLAIGFRDKVSRRTYLLTTLQSQPAVLCRKAAETGTQPLQFESIAAKLQRKTASHR
jgi:hypothetical protein